MSSNTPQLRFAEFSGEWTPSKIGADFRFISTNSLSRDNLNYEEGVVKNIHYGDIHKKFRILFDADKEAVPYINSDISLARIGSDNYLQNGDVVFVDASEDYAETGKCIEVKKTANQAIIAGLHTIHARPKYDNTFAVGFFAYLANTRNVRQQIRVISQGTKVLSISPTTLAGVSTFYPKDTVEQQKIGSFLSAVDSKIEGLEHELGLLKRYKQGIMQRLFNQTLRFKDNQGNPFPDWQETIIKNVLTIGSGRDYKHLDNGNIPVYGTGGLMSYVNDYLYDGESVCIGRKGTISSPIYLEGKFWTVDTLFYTHSFRRITPKFFRYIAQNINWLRYNEASGVPSLSKSTIEKIEISLPHIDEQKKIADFLSAIDKKIEAKQNQIATARNWKKSLLQKMFV